MRNGVIAIGIVALTSVLAVILIALSYYDQSSDELKLKSSDLNQKKITAISELPKEHKFPKIFALDLDGTFYTSNKQSYKKNIRAFEILHKYTKYIPVFCTARPRGLALKLVGNEFIRKTGYIGFPGIYFNGSIVYSESGKIIHRQCFSRMFMERLFKWLEDENLFSYCVFYSILGSYSLTEIEMEIQTVLRISGGTIPIIINEDKMMKIDIASILFLTKDGNLDIPGLKSGIDYVAKSGCSRYYTINPPGVTKATGIRALLSYFEITDNDIAFIGDGDNDAEALNELPITFAVGNASAYIKQQAKYNINLTHDQAAFAEIAIKLYDIDL